MKVFCSTTVDTAVKMAAIVAGSEFAAKNPDLAKTALPVAQGIMTQVDGGGSQSAINGVFALGVQELLAHVTDPIVSAAIQGVLASVKFDSAAKTPALLDNAVIKDIVDGFVSGMSAVKQGVRDASTA